MLTAIVVALAANVAPPPPGSESPPPGFISPPGVPQPKAPPPPPAPAPAPAKTPPLPAPVVVPPVPQPKPLVIPKLEPFQPGPRELGDGLVVEDLVPPPAPEAGQPPLRPIGLADFIIAAHTVKMADGTLVEEVTRQAPLAKFVARLMPGYTKGIVGLAPGGKRRITIPPNLGYGDKAVKKVPASSTLTIEVELLGAMYVDDTLEGTGPACPAGSSVVVNTIVTLLPSERVVLPLKIPANPATLNLGKTIDALRIGIPGMKVGGKRTLTVPWELAFGDAGEPPTVPPRTDVMIDIELLGFKVPTLPNGRPIKVEEPKVKLKESGDPK